MQTIEQQLVSRLAAAFAKVLGKSADEVDPTVRPATDPKFGDYQSNAAMALAKQARTNPRQLAEQVVAAADLDDLCENVEIAGPGFINLRLKREFIAGALLEVAGDERLGVPPAGSPQTVVVDYSSPNIAKAMHIGHIRSTVIGDALVRLIGFQGHQVIRQNHVGDWGTQFGMLAAFLDELGDAAGDLDLSDTEEFYRQAKRRFDSDPEFEERARAYVVKLQQGDEHVLANWDKIVQSSLQHCQHLYDRLGVLLTTQDARGESAYNDDLAKVVEELDQAGLLVASEGAMCVFLEQFKGKEGEPRPLIVQKTGGGYLYATTDLAAVRYRVGTLNADRIIYVTDARQADHFAYMFAVARAAGFAPEDVELTYVAFGTIQGPDGKPMKTREGDLVPLESVLDEAERRALAVVKEKNPELPPEQQAEVARVVGIAAVKYFDLSNNRLSDYRFDWDQMLALTGNTAPYLLYAYARIRSIYRKGGVSDEQAAAIGHAPALAHPAERELAKHIAQFGEGIERVIEDYRPNLLCDYLYELARRFSGFYTDCPVLDSDEPTRSERLLLCRATAAVLKHGLNLLGIQVLEQM